MTKKFYSINITGYIFLSQPSCTNTGGVGFYVKNNLGYINCSDLLAQAQNDYESVWVKIQDDTGHNTIHEVFYRDPYGNLHNFLNHINMIFKMIHCENKYCVLLGDFNLDLLKFESHPSAENVLNTLGTFYFQSQILQPTTVTDHSATLFDDIFFNSLEHFSIGENFCYDSSDHLPNFLIVNRLSFPPVNIMVFRQDYSNFDKQALITDIQSINWDDLIEVVLNQAVCLVVSTIRYLRLLIYINPSSNYLNKN